MSARLVAASLLLVAGACVKPAPPRDDVRQVRDTTRVAPPRSGNETAGPLTQANRDSLIREATARRDRWRARGITSYRITVAVGCFCPWPSTPAVLEVKDGVAVGLRDTTGRSMGKPREPWSSYTVEGLFDAVLESARRGDAVAARFDSRYDYPVSINGSRKVGPDTWYWMSAGRLTPF